jgi:hypothetical protein
VDDISYGTWQGLIVTLEELDTILRLISHGPHRWTASLEKVAMEEGQASRPCSDMPNEISYLFPAFDDAMLGETYILVCLHSSLAIPVVKGLYFEQDSLKHDLLADWQRFWPPLRQALSAVPSPVNQVQFGDF